MKKIIALLLIILSASVFAQVKTSATIPDSLIMERTAAKTNQISASCASPSGTMLVVAAPPPSYAWLQANGYCHPASYGSVGTVCWSFVPTQNSVTINSGFSTTGCGSITFGPFNLYACSPSCTLVGSGLSFGVTPGQCYTWCMGYNGTGGLCSFNDFCPYFQQNTILPIELLYFAGSNQGDVNVLQWKTATETNNSFFSIETSDNAQDWAELTHVNGAGTSVNYIEYKYTFKNFSKSINYYRIKQVDFDGGYKYHGIIAIDNSLRLEDNKILHIYNVFGQEVNSDYKGVVILYYDNGVITKRINN